MGFLDFIPVVGDVVNGVFGLVQQNQANKHNQAMQNAQNEFEMQMAQYQNQYNTEMWEKQNAYNSPKQQMKRLQQAGLNPALMYGNVSSGNASAPAAAVKPNIGMYQKSFANMDFIGNAIKDAALAVHQSNMRKAAERTANAKAGLAETQNTVQSVVAMDRALQDLYGIKLRNAKTEDERKKIQQDMQLALEGNARRAAKAIDDHEASVRNRQILDKKIEMLDNDLAAYPERLRSLLLKNKHIQTAIQALHNGMAVSRGQLQLAREKAAAVEQHYWSKVATDAEKEDWKRNHRSYGGVVGEITSFGRLLTSLVDGIPDNAW